jgi:hypothetical protein
MGKRSARGDTCKGRTWKDRMLSKPKLRTYRQLKQHLTCEQYLTFHDRRAREIMTTLRGGTNELRIERGRYPITNRDKRLEVHERVCLMCMSGEVEDEKHFLLDCVIYEDLRGKMWEAVKSNALTQGEDLGALRKDEQGRRRLMAATLAESVTGRSNGVQVMAASMTFVKRAMSRRRGLVQALDFRT